MPLSPLIPSNSISTISTLAIDDENTPLLKDHRSDDFSDDNSGSRVAFCRDEEDFISIASTLVDTEQTEKALQSQNVAGVISVLLLGTYRTFLTASQLLLILEHLNLDYFISSLTKRNFRDCVFGLFQHTKCRKFAHHTSLGVFIANADGSLVLATSGTISSDFDDLGSAGWLITSYTLAMCAAQSLVSLLRICGSSRMLLANFRSMENSAIYTVVKVLFWFRTLSSLWAARYGMF
jgi:hypothetical protein